LKDRVHNCHGECGAGRSWDKRQRGYQGRVRPYRSSILGPETFVSRHVGDALNKSEISQNCSEGVLIFMRRAAH